MDNRNTEQLKLLANAIIQHPRATLQELAEVAGFSKATLHRNYGTRDKLLDQIFELARSTLNVVFVEINLENEDIEATLIDLINIHYEHSILLRFLCANPTAVNEDEFTHYIKWLNSFFLFGQKQGFFKIELSASVLTEVFVSLLYGLIESSGRGRIAKANVTEYIRNTFLFGTKNLN